MNADRGRAAPESIPADPHSQTLDERLARMEAAGEITLPRGRPLKLRRAARVLGRPVSKTVLDDRR